MPRAKRKILHLTPNDKLRLREIQFWFLIRQIMVRRPDPGFLYDLVETFATLFSLPSLPLQRALKDVIIDEEYLRPLPDEAMLLLYAGGIPVQTIFRLTNRSQTTLERIIQSQLRDPCAFMPRYATTDSEVISKFVEEFRSLTPVIFYKETYTS